MLADSLQWVGRARNQIYVSLPGDYVGIDSISSSHGNTRLADLLTRINHNGVSMLTLNATGEQQ